MHCIFGLNYENEHVVMNQNISFGVNCSSSPSWLIGQRLIACSNFGVIAKSLLEASFD
jgi:hypothetical protein